MGIFALALASGALGMVGVFLDTAWHRTIGRDSFFIWPHLFIYGGAAGIWAASVESIAWATRGGAQEFGGPILRIGRLRCPFGFAVAALGILIILAAVPVDAWWHAVWGKDVLIWSVPHLQLHFGAGVTAIGLLFAIAAQKERGWFRRPWVWRGAMLLVVVDLIHRGHFVLAHYTMIPESRTPEFYPFLASLLFPWVLVAAAQALGPWAPTVASLLFLWVAAGIDWMLRVIEFDRYTLTPLVVIPACALTLLGRAAGEKRYGLQVALLSGVIFALIFTALETFWMAGVVGRPWMWKRVLAGLPRSLLAGVLGGYVGWVLGGFLRAVGVADGEQRVFGSRRRARLAAVLALGLAVFGLATTYHPQRYGPPMTVEELRLAPIDTFRYQEAVFWEVLLHQEWGSASRIEARSEGIIDGFPLLIGPAWCAASEPTLSAGLPHVRFGLEINGTPVDLSRYPIVRLPLRDGRACGWVGVASRFQRASRNRFVYTIEFPAAPGRTMVTLAAVFKDP